MSNQNNEIPEGFRMTEIGLLPEEWETPRLGDLFEIKQGKALSPEHRRGINPRPFLRTANVFWGYIELATIDSMDFTDNEVAQLKLTPDDLLVCEGGDIGRTAIWRGQLEVCCYQNHLHRLRTSRDDVHPLFYMYWMQAAYLLLDLYGGTGNKTTIPNLSQSRLKSFELPLPSLPVQKAIARVLSTIQKDIDTQDKIIATARELKKSLMRHLFTYGPVPVAEAENVPLKETEIGLVPEHWEVVRLGQKCDVKGGKRLPKGHTFADKPTAHPYIRVVDFRNGSINVSNLKFLTDEDFRIISRYIITCEDVYISIAGTIGLVGTIPEALNGANLTENAAKLVIREKNGLSKDFLKYCLSTDNQQQQISQLTTKTSQPKLALARIQQIMIPFPSISEQQEIIGVLTSMDNKIEVEENRRSALQSLFKTMLHQLMTGKVRVKDLEATTA